MLQPWRFTNIQQPRSSTTHLKLVDLKQSNMLHISKMFVDFNETEPKSNTVYLLYLKILEIPREGWGERKLPGKKFSKFGYTSRGCPLFWKFWKMLYCSIHHWKLPKIQARRVGWIKSAHFPLWAILHGEGAVWERGSVGTVLFWQQPAKSAWACSGQTDYCTCDDIRGLNGIKGTRGGNGGNAGTPGEIYH